MRVSPDGLEQMLMLATDSPASRPYFYNTLMISNVFVIGSSDEGHVGVNTPRQCKIVHPELGRK
jgi:hypothetical protein